MPRPLSVISKEMVSSFPEVSFRLPILKEIFPPSGVYFVAFDRILIRIC